jgi:tetratricopeptide (TPR) repeat protein
MSATLTAQLITELPEALWPEGARRLRRAPWLQSLAENAEVRRAFVEHGLAGLGPDPDAAKSAHRFGSPDAAAAWRPGPLALAAYAVRHPECAGNAEAWLLGPGRDRLGAAYAFLTASEAPLHPLDDALPAALALRLRMAATADWRALATDAAANPERWRLPLQLLWGLWSGEHEGLFTALLQASPAGAALAADCVIPNLAPGEIVEFVARLGLSAPDSHWLAFGQALAALGEHDAAREVLRPRAAAAAAEAKNLPPAWNPLELNLSHELERSLLVAATEDYALAHPVLTTAWTQLRQLRATIASHIGRLAVSAGDLVVALAAYQDAFAERPEDLGLRVGLAGVLTRLSRPAEALALLEGCAEPEAQAAAAAAHLALGQQDRARELLRALNLSAAQDDALLSETARLLQSLDEPAAAAEHLQRAARLAGTNAAKHLSAAQALLAAGRAAEAGEFAHEAVAFAPHSAQARETLGQALLETGQPAAAIAHFQAAAAADPGRISAALGLARAGLAAGQPETAHAAADKVLAQLTRGEAPTESQTPLLGDAHTLLGQALSHLGRESEAFENFRRASALVPAAPEPWRAMAQHYLRHQQPAEALATLEAGRQALALGTSPDAASLLVDLAERYVAAERQTEAILALREACAADPRGAEAHRRLGMLLRRQGSLGEAVEWLRAALVLQPGDGLALHELAKTLERLGKNDEAWAAYQQAALTRPAEPEPYLDLGRVTLGQVRKGLQSASPLQAIAALRAALDRAPELPEAHGLLAEAQHLAGDPQGALQSYQRALHLAPMRTDWSLGLGQVCLELKQPAIAIASLDEALNHAPDSPAVHSALAQAYAGSGLWPEARRAAEAALRLDPENAEVMSLAAEAAGRLGDQKAALSYWRQAVALSPTDAALHIRYARCLLDLGQSDDARAVFTQALAMAPDDAATHLAAGQAFLQLGELDQALSILAQAVALAPHTAEIQAAYGLAAMRAGKFETAHAAYRQAAEIDSGPTRARYLREAGEALWSLNRQAAAVALWQRALALAAHDQPLRARLGLALLQLGQPVEALEHLEHALRHNPRDTALARAAAQAALALDRLDHAAELLQGAIELNPGDADARLMLGQVREQEGQLDAALNLYRQAARVAPGDGRHLAATATALARAARLPDAIKVMEEALRISPDSADVQQQAGELFLQVNRPTDAVRAFQHLTAARPGDGSAHLALARALAIAAESAERAVAARAPIIDQALLQDVTAQITAAAQHAAALGADPVGVRYWLCRARALGGDAREAQRLLESVLAAQNHEPAPAAKSERPSASPALAIGELYRALGVALREAGQPDRARDALQAAVQSSPAGTRGDNAATYVELGLTDLTLKDPQAAAVNFRRAIAAAPNLALAHYHLGVTLLGLGDALQAAQVLQRALALEPDVAAWHHQLAQVHQALYDGGSLASSAAALGHLQRAAELEPGNAQYAADLARALARDGDLAAAIAHFERATASSPADARLWTERGQTHLVIHDYERAAKCFAQALEASPGFAAALLGAARVSLALGSIGDAALKAEAAVHASPEDPDALMCLADVCVARGDAAAGERHYGAAANRAARPAPALVALGRLYAQQQKWDKALAALERATTADPNSDEVFAALGEVHAASGNPALATKAFREATRIAPRRAAHLLRLGRACRAQGQLDQALAHLMQARDLAPGDDEILREIGLVFDQRKQFDRALDMYKLAIEVAPKSSQNYTRAGVALKNLKSIPEAMITLERAVALDPKNPEAIKQLAVVSAINLVQANTKTIAPAGAAAPVSTTASPTSASRA